MTRAKRTSVVGETQDAQPSAVSSAPSPFLAPAVGQRPALRFALVFAALAAALLGLYYFPYAPGSRADGWVNAYLRGYAATAGFVLSWFEPHLNVVGQNITGRCSLRIVKTCDAMDVKILFVSAVLAWPARWPRRATAVVGGVFVLFLLNIVRICTLYYVGLYSADWFEFAHLELWPAVILVVAVAMFVNLAAWERDVAAPSLTFRFSGRKRWRP